jgi:triacylglycerol lipase
MNQRYILSLLMSVGACQAGIDGSGITDSNNIQTNLTCDAAPYPIVLAHGMSGFDHLGPLDYFFKVADELTREGEIVYTTEVPPFQSSAVRGDSLALQIDQILEETGSCKVNVIAHSQGGLDIRYVIGSLGYGDRIASVVTVSTPHRGSKVADVVLGLTPGGSSFLLEAFAGLIGRTVNDLGSDSDLQASLLQLSEATAAQFALDNPDDPAVAFYSIAGRSLLSRANDDCGNALWNNSGRTDLVDPLLLPTGLLLQGLNPLRPVANDGLVTVKSAKWGTFLGCIPADHLDEVGQLADLIVDPWSKFNHLTFYKQLATFIHDEGF